MVIYWEWENFGISKGVGKWICLGMGMYEFLCFTQGVQYSLSEKVYIFIAVLNQYIWRQRSWDTPKQGYEFPIFLLGYLYNRPLSVRPTLFLVRIF